MASNVRPRSDSTWAVLPVALAAGLASCAPRPAGPCPDARLPAAVAPVDALAAAGPPPTTSPAEPLANVTLTVRADEPEGPRLEPGLVCVFAGDGYRVECWDDGSAALVTASGRRVPLNPGLAYRRMRAMAEAEAAPDAGRDAAYRRLEANVIEGFAEQMLVGEALSSLPAAGASEVRRPGPDADALLPLARRLLDGPVALKGRHRRHAHAVTAAVELTPAGRRALADAVATRDLPPNP